MTIPIVFLTGADPVKDGLVNRPGGNLTGVTTLNVEIVPKRQSLLRATADRDPLYARHGVLCLALGGGSCAAEIFSCPCRLGVKLGLGAMPAQCPNCLPKRPYSGHSGSAGLLP